MLRECSPATPSAAGALDVGSRPQPGRSFHGETTDPTSKQPEAVKSVNHSLLLTCSECRRLRGGGGVDPFYTISSLCEPALWLHSCIICYRQAANIESLVGVAGLKGQQGHLTLDL